MIGLSATVDVEGSFVRDVYQGGLHSQTILPEMRSGRMRIVELRGTSIYVTPSTRSC